MDISLLPGAEQLFGSLLLFAVLLGVLYSIVVGAMIERREDPRQVWIVAVLVLAGVSILSTAVLTRFAGPSLTSFIGVAVSVLPMFALPLLVASAIMHRLRVRRPAVSRARLSVLALLGYLAVLPLGVLLGSLL